MVCVIIIIIIIYIYGLGPFFVVMRSTMLKPMFLILCLMAFQSTKEFYNNYSRSVVPRT